MSHAAVSLFWLRHHWMHVLTMMAFVLVSLPAGILIYWYFDWTPPMRIQHPENTRVSDLAGIERRDFRAGDTMRIWRGACVDRRVPWVRRRWLADAQIITLPTVEGVDQAIAVGTCNSLWVWLDLPKSLTPGTWVYHAESSYQLNPLRTVTVRWPSVSFNIVATPQKKVEALEKKVKELEQDQKILSQKIERPKPQLSPVPSTPIPIPAPAPKPTPWWRSR